MALSGQASPLRPRRDCPCGCSQVPHLHISSDLGRGRETCPSLGDFVQGQAQLYIDFAGIRWGHILKTLSRFFGEAVWKKETLVTFLLCENTEEPKGGGFNSKPPADTAHGNLLSPTSYRGGEKS